MEAEETQAHFSEDPAKPLWMSYSAGHGPEIRSRAQTLFGISVCCDAQVGRQFAGLRVVLVRGPNVSRSLVLNECPGFDCRERGLHKPARFLPKELYSANAPREGLQKIRKLNVNHGGGVSAFEKRSLPIWTITLEFVEILDMGEEEDEEAIVEGHTLIPMTEFGEEVLPLRKILYDKTWMHGEDNLSTVLWFEMEPSTRCLLHPTSRYYGGEIPVYCVRLLPATLGRAFMKDLPSCAIKWIIRHALDPFYEEDWRYRVFDYALLRKSWLPALDIFWELFGHSRYRGNPILIARSLQRQPNKAHLISLFYDDTPAAWKAHNSADLASLRDACQAIVFSARVSLTSLAIEGVNLPVIMPILPDMKGLRHFTVLSQGGGNHGVTKDDIDWTQYVKSQQPSTTGAVTVDQIGDAFSHWPFIEFVTIGGLNCETTEGVFKSELHATSGWKQGEVSSSIGHRPANGTLKLLNIQESRLDAYSLGKFTSSSLAKLHLWRVTGIRNADLAELLTSACMSLVEIFISQCQTVIPTGQLHALEQVLPKMTKISAIHLMEEHGLSPMIVSGKQQRDRKSRRSITSRLVISARDGSHFFLDALAEAVEMTGWDAIMFAPINLHNDPRWQEAKRVADRRGVTLIYRS